LTNLSAAVKLKKMKKLLPIALILLALAIVSPSLTSLPPVLAQEDSTSSSLPPRRGADRMEPLNTRLAQAANRLDSMKERIASKTAELKAKLAAFKDKNKAKRVEGINGRLADINAKRSEKMDEHLNKMSNVLTKAENKLEGRENTTAAVAAIGDAKSAVDAAKQAVSSQMEKDYTIDATSEATIKADSMKARDMLHQDLKAVHSLVVAARQSVAAAISATATALGGSNGQ
jgi:hypothetical protein